MSHGVGDRRRKKMQDAAGACSRANTCAGEPVSSEHFVIVALCTRARVALHRYMKRIRGLLDGEASHAMSADRHRITCAASETSDASIGAMVPLCGKALLGPMSKICHSRNGRQHRTHLPSR